MAATHLTSTSALRLKSLPSHEGLWSSRGFPSVNVSLVYPSSARRSFHGLITSAASVSEAKYTSIKPLGDRVMIKIKEVEKKTSSGLHLPSSALKKKREGEVVAVGLGKRVGDGRLPVAVEIGKNVLYSKSVGTEVEVNGISHLIVEEDDIIGILETKNIKDLRPLNDRILIKVDKAELKTAAGLLLSESVKEKPPIGTVIAAGPGDLDKEGNREALPVSIGDTVMFSWRAGNNFKGSDGSDYVAIRAFYVKAVLS